MTLNFKSKFVKLTAAAALTLTGVAATNSVKPAAHVQAASQVVKVNYVPGYGIAVWSNYEGGHTTGQYLQHGSSYKVIKTVKDSQGNTWYDLGLNQWIMAKYTVSANTAVSQAASTATTNATSQAQAVINIAKQQIGKPYVWGAAGPSSFDCSGLTSYAFSKGAGKNIGRTTYTQLNAGKRVSVSQLQPGDLVFWGNYHVGIYLGNNQYIHAPQPGQNVTVASISSYFYPSYGVRVF
ncbi:C40 family peptidase [Lactobacillus hominis]|uniref:C40 family peptidase n=1 Tax=Lactobacillus hominis TaxID=1203033 RepID=UPI0002FF1E1E|nr:C40 family peptidase [Lactobacillus hominis]KRM85124.1 cell wall-associated hydrolase [Lactobacillus hominis DSM 23910 = CRBIP 24.179]MCT3348284.1 peptidoglycan endopeptidase [Lactobacillus hominis]